MAVRMGELSKGMQGVVKGMEAGLESMNVEQLSAIMDKFEKQFEDLDVRSAYMDDAMNSTTATSAPTSQVDELIQMVADEHNLALGEAFADAGPIKKKVSEPAKTTPTDDLEARFANLKS